MKVTYCTCRVRYPFEPFQVTYLNGCPTCQPDLWRPEIERTGAVLVPLAKLTWAEAEAFLQAVVRGEITLTPERLTPQEVYCGNVRFLASNGWSVTVFNGCDEFKYIDDVVDLDGRFLDYNELYWEKSDVFAARQNNEDEPERQDAQKFHPDEFSEKELAIWHWQ